MIWQKLSIKLKHELDEVDEVDEYIEITEQIKLVDEVDEDEQVESSGLLLRQSLPYEL